MFEKLLSQSPSRVSAATDRDILVLASRSGNDWQAQDVNITLFSNNAQVDIFLSAPQTPIQRVYLSWNIPVPSGWRFLGDAWERGYGDLEWRGIVPERTMPWYVVASNGPWAGGVGVKTGCAALAYWQVNSSGITLVLDVRCGTQGVLLADRRLHVATIIAQPAAPGVSPFAAARALCSRLCDHARLPDHPVYGANDWYYRYGHSTQQSILEDARITAGLSSNADNRPYAVVDAGWQVGRRHEHDLDSGDRTWGNSDFPDLPGLAAELKTLGVHPGIWVRPLIAPDGTSPARLLQQAPNAVYAYLPILDPSIPENLNLVAEDIRRLSGWGYQLIKHDFTTVDILGRWGFEMGSEVTGGTWAFQDRGRTTAEIITDLYRTVRAGAGETLIIGCNTIGHLGAGWFDLQRTGDDTSGKEWERTRKMGVNTLAFRMPQHGTFFFADADCVGLTDAISWELNAQWLDLLARSGTPLFVSADPQALGPEQKQALARAYDFASQVQPCAEPIDWLDTVCPTHWQFSGQETSYNWYAAR